jgi:hypothetical protein
MLRYSSRFWLYAPISLFLALAVAAILHWFWAAGAFEKKLAALKGGEIAPGIVDDWQSASIGGFPFRIDADFTDLSLKGAGAHGPFAWSSERFALHALTYGRQQDIFEAAGTQRFVWMAPEGAVRSVFFLPATFRASAILDARGLARFDLDILDAGGRDQRGRPFTAARTQFHMRRDPDGQSLDVMASADALKSEALSFAKLRAYWTLTEAEALMPLLAGKAKWPEALANWRARGGAVKAGPGTIPGLLTPLL